MPSAAALLTRALTMADALRPAAGYRGAVEAVWSAAAPYVKQSPMACAGLIDAML